MATTPVETTTKSQTGAAVYLAIAVAVIVGTIGFFIYIFSGR